MTKTAHWRPSLLICLSLAAMIVIVYWPVYRFEFINYDDNVNVSANPHVQRGLTADSVVWAFTTTEVDYWRPLTYLTHMLDWQVYGAYAGGHHCTNVLLHLVNTLLLFAVLTRMTGTVGPSAFVAGLFALHPLHVASVAWVTERKDVLSGLFYMLTLLAYARYVERRSTGHYVTVLLCFALGLMAKPTVVTLPFLLLLLDVWPLKRLEREERRWVRLILEKIPLILLAVAASVLTYAHAQRSGQLHSTQEWSVAARLANALVSYVRYLGKTLVPVGLSVYYPLPEGWPTSTVLGSFLLLVVVSGVAIREWRRRPNVLVGWLWFIGTLVPVIGLVRAGIDESIADRYTYLPLIGLFVMVAWSVPADVYEQQVWRIVVAAGAVTLLVMCALLSELQLRYWKDTVALFQHAVDVNPEDSLTQYNLGVALLQAGRIQEAIRHDTEALQLKPDYAPAFNNLANALLQQGKVQEAIGHYEEALRIWPKYAEAHNNLGNALLEAGRIQEAIHHEEEALRLMPDYPDAHNNLANALLQQGKVQEAIRHYQEALRLKPDFANAHYNLAMLQANLGHPAEAIPHLEAALKLEPDSDEFRRALSIVRQMRTELQPR